MEAHQLGRNARPMQGITQFNWRWKKSSPTFLTFPITIHVKKCIPSQVLIGTLTIWFANVLHSWHVTHHSGRIDALSGHLAPCPANTNSKKTNWCPIGRTHAVQHTVGKYMQQLSKDELHLRNHKLYTALGWRVAWCYVVACCFITKRKRPHVVARSFRAKWD